MNILFLRKRVKDLIWPNKENDFHPFILKDEVIAVFILLFLLVKVLFSFELILVQQSSLFAEVNAQKIIVLTNDIRRQYNLPPVKENNLLDKAAREKAQDMLRNQYFNHYSPSGISPWHWMDVTGYDYHYAGENLAMNFFDSDEVIKAWLNSPSHRENLLNGQYQDMGVAILNGDFTGEGIDRTLVVQMFGSPMKKTIIPVAKAASPSIPTTTTTAPPVVIVKATTSSTNSPVATTITTTVSTTTSTTKPISVIGQDKDIITPASLKANVLSNVSMKTYQQINTANRILAGLLIFLGGMVIVGIVWQQRKASFAFSELLMRSVIVIALGIAFIAFNFPALMGELLIA